MARSPSAHYLRKLLAALEQAASGAMPLTAQLPEPLERAGAGGAYSH